MVYTIFIFLLQTRYFNEIFILTVINNFNKSEDYHEKFEKFIGRKTIYVQ
jgi:hypothetical protein|tara:strand:- start:357 stop:506 length:150 start_codon:yes stop_codon:yes gene_type:complete